MKNKYYVFATLILFLYSCKVFSPSVSKYDNYAYTQTISVKIDALALMDEASEDITSHEKEVVEIKKELQKIYEYEMHKPKNTFITEQWKLMVDSTGNLYGGFLVKWGNEKKLGKAYIENKKKQISSAFDQIAELESKKIKESDVK